MTLAKFYRRHKSYPANPFLAYAMFLVKYIEETGTGSRDVVSLCEEAGLPRPRWFVEDGDDFRIVIRRPGADNVPVSVPVNVPVNVPVSQTTQQVIEQAIRMNPGINRKRLSIMCGLSEKTIGRQVKSMMGRVEFRGAPKTGGYFCKHF